MQPYECDPILGCGGGFGGGGPHGFAWAVSGVPYFGGTKAGNNDPGGNIIGGLIQTGIQTGANYFGQQRQQSAARSARNKEIESAWGNLVNQALTLFRSLSAKAATTADDVAQAESALVALEQFVSQYGNDYITAQWNSSAYRPAFAHDVELYRSRLGSQSAGGSPAAGDAPIISGGFGGISTSTLLLIALAVGAVFVMKN